MRGAFCYTDIKAAGTGRFSAEDPVRSGGNWYAYCGNNPVTLIDPLGLTPWMDLARSLSPGSRVSVGYVNKRVYGKTQGTGKANQTEVNKRGGYDNLSSDAKGALAGAQGSHQG